MEAKIRVDLEKLVEHGVRITDKEKLFCPDCRALVTQTENPDIAEGVKFKYCKKCDIYIYAKKPNEALVIVHKEAGKATTVIENAEDMQLTVDRACDKCGNKKAYEMRIPPRWLDEDSLVIYRCTRCGNSGREGFSY